MRSETIVLHADHVLQYSTGYAGVGRKHQGAIGYLSELSLTTPWPWRALQPPWFLWMTSPELIKAINTVYVQPYIGIGAIDGRRGEVGTVGGK